VLVGIFTLALENTENIEEIFVLPPWGCSFVTRWWDNGPGVKIA